MYSYCIEVYATYAKVLAKQEGPRTIVGMLQKWMSFFLNCHLCPGAFSYLTLFLEGSVAKVGCDGWTAAADTSWPARYAIFARTPYLIFLLY